MGLVEQLLAGIFKSKVSASQGLACFPEEELCRLARLGGSQLPPGGQPQRRPPSSLTLCCPSLRRQPPFQGWVPPVPRREGTGMRTHQLSYFALLSATSSSGKNSGGDVGHVSLQHPWRYSQRPSPRCSTRPLLYEQVRFQEYQVMK